MSGAAIIAKQNRLMRRFRQACATTPDSARTPQDLGCRDSWIFRRLVERGVFVEGKPGRYYVDEVAADEFVRVRRAWALGVLAVVLGLSGLAALVTSLMN
jgi:hypothetical protein